VTRASAAVAAVAAPLTVVLDAGATQMASAVWPSRSGLSALWSTAAALALRAAAGALAGGRGAAVLRPATVGAAGLALADPPPRLRAALLVPAVALVVLAPLGGHAAAHGPAVALAPSAVAHVAAVSAWLGALATLLIAVAAARWLPADERGGLIAAAGARVARVAPVAVAVVIATGAAQAAFHLHGPGDLVATAWGRLLLAKTLLLALMLAWAARNRRALDGDAARVAHGVGSELALAAVAVLAAAVLAGSAPPS
jgi:copper transport protein